MLSYLRVMGLVHDAQGMKQDLMTSIQIGGTARDLDATHASACDTVWPILSNIPESLCQKSASWGGTCVC